MPATGAPVVVMAGHSAFLSLDGPAHRIGPTGVFDVLLEQPKVVPWSLVMKYRVAHVLARADDERHAEGGGCCGDDRSLRRRGGSSASGEHREAGDAGGERDGYDDPAQSGPCRGSPTPSHADVHVPCSCSHASSLW